MQNSLLKNKKFYYLVKNGCNNYAKDVLNYLKEDFVAQPFTDYVPYDKGSSYLFVIGGDGLYTHAMRMFRGKDVNIIGLNYGKRGFLMNNCPKDRDDFRIFMNNLDSTFRVKVYPFKVRCFDKAGDCSTFFSFSDIYANRDLSGMLDLSVSLSRFSDDIKVVGDGIIISSPLGSTGYNYSAGGMIVPFYLDSNQTISIIKPINSYYPRNLNGFCYDSRDVLSIKINNEKYANFMIDGQYAGEFQKVLISLDDSSYSVLLYENFDFINNKIIKEQLCLS
ncbi:hypothetical protein GUI12_02165 [Anaplasmataceae bacterium AB001_6]|nr:hypothetical protein GUI12_02165 [Anaplasmataceae bacterium AB001_6]